MKPPPGKQPASQDLPDNVAQLQAMIKDLRQQLDYFKRMLFGRRSEKLSDDPAQGWLFRGAEAPSPAADTPADEPEEDEPASRRGRHRRGGRQPLPAHLPRERCEIHPPVEQRTCSCCGQEKTVFGQDVTEELEVVPARYFVKQYVRYKYACRHCQGQVSVGSLPPRPLDKGIPGPGFLAQLVAGKYADHSPLYRQQQIYRRYGLEIPRSTMCGWISYAAETLTPIVKAMKTCVKASRKVHTDDTPITVLDRPIQEGEKQTRRGYMWVYVGDQDDAVFDYTNHRNRDGPAAFLNGYQGYLQADAFHGYNEIYTEGRITEVGCWAHARRKFFVARDSHPAEARRVLWLIRRLYAVESRARAMKIDDDRLLTWRQRHSRCRLAQLRAELDRLSACTLPKSLLGKALSYTLRNWQALEVYTRAAFLSIDNNHSERQIKQMVIGRKNWMFAGSEQGAHNAAILFSLMVSCKLAAVDPVAYLRDILIRIHTHPPDRIHELIPREWKKRFGAETPADPIRSGPTTPDPSTAASIAVV